MRFRVPNYSQGGQGLAGGIGNVFRTLAMAPMYEAEAAQQYQDAESARALRDTQRQKLEFDMDSARRTRAAEEAAATAAAERTSIGSLLANGARISGVPEAQVADFSQYLQTGSLPGRYAAPADGVGPVQPTPGYYNDGTASRVMRQAGLAGQALAIGDKNTENLAKASDIYGNQALRDDVLGGRLDPAQLAQAQAATAGKALYNNIGDTGAGFNLFTGEGRTMDPGIRAIFGDRATADIGRMNAAAGASKASAASSYASADNSRASAARTRQEMQQGAKSADIIQVQQPDGSVLLVNKVTGLSRPAVGMDGKPVRGKPSEAVSKELMSINQQRALMDGAIRAVTATPTAFSMPRGLATMAGPVSESAVGRFDSDAERQARAFVFNNVSAVINERAGAAQSAQELARLRGFLPAETDNAEQVISKLNAFKTYLADMEAGTTGVPSAAPIQNAGPPRIASDAEYNALPPGSVFIDPQGKQRRKP